MGPYSTKKCYIFQVKETSLRKKCIYGMFILSFKKTCTKNELKKKLYLVGEGINSRPSFFAKIFLKRAVNF